MKDILIKMKRAVASFLKRIVRPGINSTLCTIGSVIVTLRFIEAGEMEAAMTSLLLLMFYSVITLALDLVSSI